MNKQTRRQRQTRPKASRPVMPGYGILDENSGSGLIPWEWAAERLAQARTYCLATTRPDGRPHVMPLWGIWHDDTFYFSTGERSRKARNLAANHHCVVSAQLEQAAIIVEGIAERATLQARLRRFAELYAAKYRWDMEGFAEPVWIVRPTVVFGFRSGAGEFTGSATRWVFDEEM